MFPFFWFWYNMEGDNLMRRHIILLLYLLVTTSVFSQEDSLRNQMGLQLSQGDSVGYALSALELFKLQNKKGEYNKTIATLKTAMDIAPEGGETFYLIKSNYLIQSFFSNGQLKSDLHMLDTAIVCKKKATNINNSSTANLHIYTGDCYGRHGDFPKAKQHFIIALSILDTLSEQFYDQQLNCHTQIMVCEGKVQNYEAALYHSRMGMDIIPKAKDQGLIIGHYVDNAVLQGSLGMEKRADESNIMAWEIAQANGDDYTKAYTNVNRTIIHTKNREFDQAFQTINDAIAYYQAVQDQEKLLTAETHKANIYKEQGDTASWHTIMDKRLDLCRDSFYNECRAAFYSAAFEGIDILSNEEQDTLLGEQILYSKNTNDFLMLSQSYLFRANLANGRKDFEKASQYLYKHLQFQDTTKMEQLQASIAKEKTKQDVEYFEYKTQKAELQSQLLQRRNQLFITVLLALLVFLAAGYYFYRKLSASRKRISEQNNQLQQLNDTKDRFFSIIAHDLRSPISALDGVGQQMEYYLKKNDIPKLNLLSERVDKTAKNMSGLLDNLLSWALLQKGMITYNPKSVNIHESTTESLSLFSEVAQLKGITLFNQVHEKLEVYADEAALATILRNLINNAVKYTDAGGKVTVDAKEEDNRVFIIINDTGTGIGADALPKLFDVSSRSKKGTKGEKGTGLGLSLCKEMIELNKGHIKVMSELGVGTSFIFDLPMKA